VCSSDLVRAGFLAPAVYQYLFAVPEADDLVQQQRTVAVLPMVGDKQVAIGQEAMTSVSHLLTLPYRPSVALVFRPAEPLIPLKSCRSANGRARRRLPQTGGRSPEPILPLAYKSQPST